MRLISYPEAHTTMVAALQDDGTATPLGPLDLFYRDPLAALDAGGQESVDLDGVDLVPPVPAAARVLCVGLNYAAHVDEGPFDRPDHPTIFGRWTPSLAMSGAEVAVPADEAGLDWEGELLAVVGRPLRNASSSEASDAVFAYAAFNDITARRAQKLTTQWTLGKNVDASGVLSPLRTSDDVPDPTTGLGLITRLNGEVVQEAKTDEMLFSVGEILAFCSRTFTLRPGDLVATGTPSGVGYARTPPRLMQPGDEIVVDVEGVGRSSARIVEHG